LAIRQHALFDRFEFISLFKACYCVFQLANVARFKTRELNGLAIEKII